MSCQTADPRVLEAIRKLLALADNNSNSAEAAVAYRKAHELMRRHGLRLEDMFSASRPVVPPAPLKPPQTTSSSPPTSSQRRHEARGSRDWALDLLGKQVAAAYGLLALASIGGAGAQRYPSAGLAAMIAIAVYCSRKHRVSLVSGALIAGLLVGIVVS